LFVHHESWQSFILKTKIGFWSHHILYYNALRCAAFTNYNQRLEGRFMATGVAVGEELNIERVTKDLGADSSHADQSVAFADAAFEAVTSLYVELESKIVKRSAPQ
jgi:hypothetical protein